MDRLKENVQHNPTTNTIDCLKMFFIFKNVVNVITRAIKKFRVERRRGGQHLADVGIQRRIYKEKYLSPLSDANVKLSFKETQMKIWIHKIPRKDNPPDIHKGCKCFCIHFFLTKLYIYIYSASGKCTRPCRNPLHSLEQAAADIGLHVNAQKREYMCFNQSGDICTLNSNSLKLVDQLTYLGSTVSSTETDINTQLAKAETVIDRLSVIWKSDLTDKMKHSFFQAAVVSILLYGCTTWMRN